MLELLTVIAILAILASIAIPGFGYLAASTKVKNAATDVYLAMIRARSESVKRNRAVAVVATSGDANNWGAGWQIIADGNNDGDFLDVGTDDDRLIIEQGVVKRVAITMGETSVVFRPTGRVSGATPPDFDIRSEDNEYPLERCVSTDLTGRPYVRPEAC
jgi:type IV fimbrial biogenesis protein FimT